MGVPFEHDNDRQGRHDAIHIMVGTIAPRAVGVEAVPDRFERRSFVPSAKRVIDHNSGSVGRRGLSLPAAHSPDRLSPRR